MKKLKFYLIGLIPGLVIVFFILNKKGASCSGYLPNSRVIAETLSKDFEYSENFKTKMATYHINETFLKDSIITNGKVDFEKSHAQKQPCPDYVLIYPEKNPTFEITFEKCEEKVVLNNLQKLK
ncbi:hypothetical protein [Chryseobacterium potabilaquae]|uniref:DUF4258 domain-containing protein n=1 Tax=Chryseobacterium potabilaquae TaxID=2675057 RepID=A0A6N4X6L3_9FLAO|nr:hypothetical protein [Chryseobacterium potabilaquae]CAA7193779.1 hypothetical protein CHRY9293_00191 [Chryseobacterium potabilaquae]